MPERENDSQKLQTRSPQRIQASIRAHRADLVESIAELEQVVREKLDVRAHLRHAAERAARFFRERPLLLAGVVAACVMVLMRRRRA